MNVPSCSLPLVPHSGWAVGRRHGRVGRPVNARRLASCAPPQTWYVTLLRGRMVDVPRASDYDAKCRHPAGPELVEPTMYDIATGGNTTNCTGAFICRIPTPLPSPPIVSNTAAPCPAPTMPARPRL